MANKHFAVGVEGATSWGVAVVATRAWEALSESIQLDREYEEIETLSQLSVVEHSLLTEAAHGDVELLANFHKIGILYEHLFGGTPTTVNEDFDGGNAGGAWFTHTFPPTGGIPAVDRVGKSLTLQVKRGSGTTPDRKTWDYPGGKIISLGHTFSADSASRMNVGFLAKTHDVDAAPAALTVPDFQPMLPKQITVTMQGTSHAKATICARSASIEIENPVDEAFCLGTLGLSREPIRSGALKVSGSIEALYTDNDQSEAWDLGEDVEIIIEVAVGAQPNYKIQYKLAKGRLTQATPHLSGRDRLAATYEFVSIYNTGATQNCLVTLTNQDATP